MRLGTLLSAGLAAGLALFVQAAPAQETGSVTGTFVLKGEMPKLAEINPNKDPQVCAAEPVPNQRIVVDPQTKGVANVFIWVSRIDEKDIPAELRKPKEEKVVLDQKNCVFLPHCLIARAGQTLVALNDDPVAHNVRATLLRNGTFNNTVAPNDREGIEQDLKRAEILPQPVQCDIHPWMQAHLLVVDHPYAAISDEKGQFTIEGLPPGEYDFKVWQEAGGYVFGAGGLKNVKVAAGKPTDLGKLEIDATKLKP
ncbi:MAG TPA: carboxypeptidase regulatory-like domain-containing protein [Planctomycetaceae bacterium]